MGHFIFGLPGETNETAEATIRFMLRLGLDYMQCYCAVPYPKTALGAEAKAKGWIRAKDWSEYDFGGNSIMSTDSMNCEEVDRIPRQGLQSLLFPSTYILKRLFSGLSVLQLARGPLISGMDEPAAGRKRARHERAGSQCRHPLPEHLEAPL